MVFIKCGFFFFGVDLVFFYLGLEGLVFSIGLGGCGLFRIIFNLTGLFFFREFCFFFFFGVYVFRNVCERGVRLE